MLATPKWPLGSAGRAVPLPHLPGQALEPTWTTFHPQEGANINKSLTTLGKVISALAEMVSWPRLQGWTGGRYCGGPSL